ncbi:MAG: NAD-dependent epimerase/dehydratase family protein [Thermoplasmata archaeon]|nr:NAD-dependent epimerase/dehydratase family protein [Thermoplasmata archaeon]
MRVLVTGSTGFLGRHLVPALLEAGHAVRCFHRPTSDLAPLRDLPVTFAEGDVLLPRSLESALDGMDAVVHLVAGIREREATFEEVNVGGVRHLLEGCERTGVTRVVHLGSLGTSERAPNRYARSRGTGERIWRESDRAYAILRPSVVMGPGGAFTDRAIALVRRYRRVPVLGRGTNRIQPIWIGDVSRAINAALQAPPRRTWDLVGPDRVTWNAFVLRMAEGLGVSRRLRHVPPGLARLGAAGAQLLGREPLATRDELYILRQDLVGRVESYEELVGARALSLEDQMGRMFPGPEGPPAAA